MKRIQSLEVLRHHIFEFPCQCIDSRPIVQEEPTQVYPEEKMVTLLPDRVQSANPQRLQRKARVNLQVVFLAV